MIPTLDYEGVVFDLLGETRRLEDVAASIARTIILEIPGPRPRVWRARGQRFISRQTKGIKPHEQ